MKINDMVPSVRGEVKEEAGVFILPKEILIEFGAFEHWCADVFLTRCGRTLKSAGTGGQACPLAEREDGTSSGRSFHTDRSGAEGISSVEGVKPDILLCKERESSTGKEFSQEGYELTVSEDGIRIAAASEQGVVWALTTLALAVDEEGNDQISCGRICDAPRYAHRGLSLDCARHFFPAEEVKKIIEEISLAKMNVLHWHLTDDQGWRIESKRFPKLCERYSRPQAGISAGQSEGALSNGAGTDPAREYYTQDEIRKICEYARVRGVEVIPEIDMPGHVSALLHAYPEYSCSGKKVRVATAGGIYPIILCGGQEKTYSFLEDLLEEIIPLFPGKRVHLGGDEAPKGEWKKCPYCQAKMQDRGFTQWEDMQGYFMTRVTAILEKYGKTAICWNETLRASNHPENMQAQYWTLQHRDTMETFAKAGGAWIYSDMFELYLDYPYSMTPLKKLYGTVPHLGDEDVSGQENLLGLECCLWSEHITETEKLEKLLFPRTYAVAEISWNGVKNREIATRCEQNASSSDAVSEDAAYTEFEARLGRAIASRLHPQLAYTPENWWNPTGQGRQQEAFAYMASINSGMSEEEKEQTLESVETPSRSARGQFASSNI
ncbi:MAG: beta-N-acetylhexosaminidase [Lachnospiraceae bacterium]|nr:beta-N-acetylhexosaminidase [Lachnospiraceae bacterium]